METAEGNKLIAEFMELTSKEEEWRKPFPTTVFEINNKWHPLRTMEYNISWNWIMPVVSKCYSLCNHPDQEGYPDEEIKLSEALLSCDITELFTAVIEFITRYNNIKK